jgi:TM2 domain-containing membrane protein YozV
MFKRMIACAVLASFCMVSSGCFGSFQLTKKVYEFNKSLSGKFVQSIVFWAFNIVPIYDICVFIDVVILNLIEFWVGNNPLALNADTETQKTFAQNGKEYNVTMGKGSITIHETKGPDAGKMIKLTFKKDEMAWYLSNGASSQMIASFEPSPLNSVHLYYPNGKVVSHPIETPEVASVSK